MDNKFKILGQNQSNSEQKMRKLQGISTIPMEEEESDGAPV